MAQIHKLTAIEVSRTTRPGLRADGGGLYLRVRESGSKSWIFRAREQGRARDYTIGPVHTIPLAEAREIARRCRQAALQGRAVLPVIRGGGEGHHFIEAAEALIARRSRAWKSGKTAIKWRRGLMEHARPLHDLPLSAITIHDVERVLAPIWIAQNHSARMTRGMIEQAIDLATALGWRDGDNPARWRGALEYVMPDHRPPVRHHAAMPYAQAPEFYQRLLASRHVTRAALAFTMLTAARGHMVREAVWAEIDRGAGLWTIPAARMKRSAEDHVVPLTAQMLALLPPRRRPRLRIRGAPPPADLVFPFRGKPFSENAFRSTLRAMGEPYSAHGFRSTFKDWAADETDFPDEVSELALAHKVGGAVRRAYRRGLGLARRRELMQRWSDYLAGPAPGARAGPAASP